MLQTKLSQDCFSGLALLDIHQQLDISVEAIIDHFANSKNSNLDLII